MQDKKKHIAILGSTGSIGTQTLEVIDSHPDKFVVEVLTANNNSKLLIKQAVKYKPNVVVIANKDKYCNHTCILSCKLIFFIMVYYTCMVL